MEHQWEIRRVLGYVDFASTEPAPREFLAASAWTRRERPSELFNHAVVWLRDGKVLLPGVSVLTRLVSELRAGADQQVYSMITAGVPFGRAERLGCC